MFDEVVSKEWKDNMKTTTIFKKGRVTLKTIHSFSSRAVFGKNSWNEARSLRSFARVLPLLG